MRAPTRRNVARTAALTSAALVLPITLVAGPAQAVDTVPNARAAAAPAHALTAAQRKHLRAVSTRSKLVAFAKAKKKTGRYVYGAAGNNVFDCSGYTKLIYKKVAHINLPHYSVAQMHRTHRVSKRHLQPGDLLFWGPGGRQHVSMYIGHGKMIGANSPSSGVQIESINAPYWRHRYAGAGRLIMG